MFADFRAHCAYLDIETTGMGSGDQVTTIALYDAASRPVAGRVLGGDADPWEQVAQVAIAADGRFAATTHIGVRPVCPCSSGINSRG